MGGGLRLPGPVGEENRYDLHPRGTIRCRAATGPGLAAQIGAALATVVGVPLGTFLGQQIGWRIAFAIVAAIFHTVNHATFKASLFMAAGIIDHETGTRDMRRLSGLRRPMPRASALAIVAAAAMGGVPLPPTTDHSWTLSEEERRARFRVISND